jgi:hypothetical protein
VLTEAHPVATLLLLRQKNKNDLIGIRKVCVLKNRQFLLALAAGTILASGASHAVPWQNDLLNVQVLSPNPQTVAFNGNFNVPASNIEILGEKFFLLSIGANTVTFQYTGNAGLGELVPTLVKITDTTASNIQNVQVNSASTITLPTSLVSGNNFLQFDLADALIPPLSILILNVTFTAGIDNPNAVPAPAALPLFGLGLLGLAWVRRRANTTSESV